MEDKSGTEDRSKVHQANFSISELHTDNSFSKSSLLSTKCCRYNQYFTFGIAIKREGRRFWHDIPESQCITSVEREDGMELIRNRFSEGRMELFMQLIPIQFWSGIECADNTYYNVRLSLIWNCAFMRLLNKIKLKIVIRNFIFLI